MTYVSDQEGIALAKATAKRIAYTKGGSKTRPVSPLGSASKAMTTITTDTGSVSRHWGHLSPAQLRSVAMQKRAGITACYGWTSPTATGEIVASVAAAPIVLPRHPAHQEG